MHTKLTLRLRRQLIRRAKAYARRSGKSVSEIVADFFAHLEADDAPRPDTLSPPVRSLVGALAGKHATEEDYRRHLAAKHR